MDYPNQVGGKIPRGHGRQLGPNLFFLVRDILECLVTNKLPPRARPFLRSRCSKLQISRDREVLVATGVTGKRYNSETVSFVSKVNMEHIKIGK